MPTPRRHMRRRYGNATPSDTALQNRREMQQCIKALACEFARFLDDHPLPRAPATLQVMQDMDETLLSGRHQTAQGALRRRALLTPPSADVQVDEVTLLLGEHGDADQRHIRVDRLLDPPGDDLEVRAPLEVREEGVVLAPDVELGEHRPQIWPHERRPVEVEVVDDLHQGGVPDEDEELLPTEAGLAQGVHTVDVVNEKDALAVGLLVAAHVRCLDVRPSA
eukprot:CAMPEP_0176322732 /NCGR_PEP_ID=MMETSP0121_2-20121125/72020_1 /TAXON_ID=160619 /ORGANISM="Kryptoperidinium foliaceum, Strain CCMP 1326" /LENGTH=221 /DNA_ID=CAMNT_0017665223 /DNA_START=165 /DNA_END=828 /DNA_ORIENTATION=+